MNDIPWKKSASASHNGDFINIKTYSGYRMALADPEAPEYFLEPDVSDEELGQAALTSIKNSRFLSLDEAKSLRLAAEQNYKDWIEKTMARYGYKTKRAMFKKMISCDVEMHESEIVFSPTHHEKLESWSGTGQGGKDNVKIPADSTPGEIGAALRLAFSRCTGSGPWD